MPARSSDAITPPIAEAETGGCARPPDEGHKGNPEESGTCPEQREGAPPAVAWIASSPQRNACAAL
jgi:hypothetical protein